MLKFFFKCVVGQFWSIGHKLVAAWNFGCCLLTVQFHLQFKLKVIILSSMFHDEKINVNFNILGIAFIMPSDQKLHRVPLRKSERILTRRRNSVGGISCKVYSTFRTSYMFTGRTLKSPVYRCRMILPKRNKIRAKNRTITRCLLYDVSFEGAEHSCPLSTAHPGRQLLPVRLQQRTRSLLLITRTNQLYSSISPVGPDCSQSPARSATPGPELPPALHSSRL